MDHSSLRKTVTGCRDRIAYLELRVLKLERTHFGPSSEKTSACDSQLELGLDREDHPSDMPEQPARSDIPERQRPSPARKSRALPSHLRREVRTHLPEHRNCPDCGGKLRQLGEDVSEMLEYVPASFVVIRHVRPKFSCTCCSSVVQAPAPSRPIDKGIPGPGTLAHVITAKYADHIPLYRQSQIYAREE